MAGYRRPQRLGIKSAALGILRIEAIEHGAAGIGRAPGWPASFGDGSPAVPRTGRHIIRLLSLDFWWAHKESEYRLIPSL